MTLKTNRQQKSVCPARNGQLPRRAIEAVRVARGRVDRDIAFCCRDAPRTLVRTELLARWLIVIRWAMVGSATAMSRDGDEVDPQLRLGRRRDRRPARAGSTLIARPTRHASGRVKREARRGDRETEGVVFALVVTSPLLRLVVSRPPGRRAMRRHGRRACCRPACGRPRTGRPAAPQGARQPPHPAEVRAHKTERVRVSGLSRARGFEPPGPQSSALTRLRYAPGHRYREEIRRRCAAPQSSGVVTVEPAAGARPMLSPCGRSVAPSSGRVHHRAARQRAHGLPTRQGRLEKLLEL